MTINWKWFYLMAKVIHVDSLGNEYLMSTKKSCQCAQPAPPMSVVHTSTPSKSQIIIMSSKEMALSSDESVTIDVGHESDIRNPWGNLNLMKFL